MLTWRTGYRLLEQQRSGMRQREDEFIAWVLEQPTYPPARRGRDLYRRKFRHPARPDASSAAQPCATRAGPPGLRHRTDAPRVNPGSG